MRLFFSLLAVFTAALAAADVATLRDWPSYGGTYSALRYSALDQINTSNVKGLGPVWVFQTGDYENGLQATPIVVDGVIYLSTSNAWVFALDGASGRVIWEYHFTLGKVMGYGKQNRGVAVGHGRVVRAGPRIAHRVLAHQPLEPPPRELHRRPPLPAQHAQSLVRSDQQLSHLSSPSPPRSITCR